MYKVFQDYMINYFLRNRAPKRITYSSSEETRVFGFWVYLGSREDAYVIQDRIGKLKYECLKVDAPASSAGKKFVKEISDKKGYVFSSEVFVNLYHNSHQFDKLSPIKAFLLGVTGLYRYFGWRENLRYRKTLRKNEKAFSLYSDRLRLLELIIDIRNKQYDSGELFPNKISKDALLKAMARASVVTSHGYYVYIEPILKGLKEEGAIFIHDEGEVEICSKAWHLTSDYYVDERRHKDNQKSLKWQRYLTVLLAIGSIGNLFKNEIRSFLGL